MHTSGPQPYQALVRQPVRPTNRSHRHARLGLFPTQDLVTGRVCKGLGSSQAGAYPSYHDMLILCSLPTLFKGLCEEPAELTPGSTKTRLEEEPEKHQPLWHSTGRATQLGGMPSPAQANQLVSLGKAHWSACWAVL